MDITNLKISGKALVVDDDPLIREVLTVSLKLMGFPHVLEASDGMAAWSLLCSEKICLVVTDWIMPGLDGLELVKRIRADTHLHDMPIVMISGKMDDEHSNLAIEAGANVFLAKPFKILALIKHINDLLANIENRCDDGRCLKVSHPEQP